MWNTSSHFSISCFRHHVFIWIMLIVLSVSLLPSLSFAQQPIATIQTLSGMVLVSGQATKAGTVLKAGDTIEVQVGGTVTLMLSDGSTLHIGGNTQITLADLTQTATGARVSRLKLLWGRVRAVLSPGHQAAGSAFDIETPNALIGVKFSQPDVEVSYNPEKLETVGIAHTVELIATNLLTSEKISVPVGSSVIIIGLIMKIATGTTTAAIAAQTGTTTATTSEAETTTTGATAGKSTMIAIGVGAAVAIGGAAASATAQKGEEPCTTAECMGDLSGGWDFSGSCVAQGCTNNMITPKGIRGPELCNMCDYTMNWSNVNVTQSGNILSATANVPPPFSFYGAVNGNVVTFNTDGGGPPLDFGPLYNRYEGAIEGNTIRGTNSGYAPYETIDGRTGMMTWEGTFMVNIRK